jgi:hypothetical protein
MPRHPRRHREGDRAVSALREIFDDFEVIFGRVEFGRMTPPINPVSYLQTASPAADGTAYPLAARESASGDFLPPLFQLSGDSE